MNLITNVTNSKGTLFFIAPSAYPLGGLATWLDYLAPGLIEKGWDVFVGLTAGRLHDVDAYRKIHPLANIVEIENKTGTREGRIRSLCAVINEVKPDIVVGVNIPDAYAAVERLRERDSKDIRAVMTIHGIQPDLYEDAREFCDVLDAVICTNKLACRLAQDDAGLEAKRIYYAPYGVELPLSQRKQAHNRPLIIAYSGRLDYFQKRVNDIPEILLELKHKDVPFEFIIAGGGPAESDLREQLVYAGLSDKVRFLGILSYSDLVAQVYRPADILLVTSLWETGPLVVWEAMAYGMVVVTSAYIGSGLEGSLIHGENCLFYPVGGIQKAAECIKTLVDSGIRKAIAEKGYRLVESNYSLKHSIEAWDKAFRKIIDIPCLRRISGKSSFPPSGRLDRLLGFRFAEDARLLMGRKFIHKDPGGEWPHSHGKRKYDDEQFWHLASQLDQAGNL